MDLAHCYEMLRAIGCDDEAETCDASYEASLLEGFLHRQKLS